MNELCRWTNVETISLLLDSEHVGIICSKHSGPGFFNYKKIHSIVLFAFLDHNYWFFIPAVSCQECPCDGFAYKNFNFYSTLKKHKFNLSELRPLLQTSVPFWKSTQNTGNILILFVADDASPLRTNSMKPFGFKRPSDMKILLDSCLSRFTRIRENGLDSWSRFKLFATKAQLTMEMIIKVMTSLAPHNMVRTNSRKPCTPVGFNDI